MMRLKRLKNQPRNLQALMINLQMKISLQTRNEEMMVIDFFIEIDYLILSLDVKI